MATYGGGPFAWPNGNKLALPVVGCVLQESSRSALLLSSIKGKFPCANYHPLHRIVLMGVIGYRRSQSRSQFLEGCMAVLSPREPTRLIAGLAPRGSVCLGAGE